MSLEITGAIIVVLAGLLIALPFLVKQRESIRNEKAARKLGFFFQSRIPEDFFRHLAGFELLRGTLKEDIYHLLFRNDRDRQYATFTGDAGGYGRSTYHGKIRVFFAASPAFDLPGFKMVPKNLGHRIDREPDINFPAFPVFSRRYLLQGEPEDKTRSLFSPRLLDYLQRRRDLVMEGQQNRLIIIHPRVPLSQLIREGLEIVSLIEDPEGFSLDPERVNI
jgi:hypothetical protein